MDLYERLKESVVKEYRLFQDYELKTFTKLQVFNHAYKISFYTEVSGFFSEIRFGDLDEEYVEYLEKFEGCILQELFDYFITHTGCAVSDSDQVRDLIVSFLDNEMDYDELDDDEEDGDDEEEEDE